MPLAARRHAAEDVAAADHQADLDARRRARLRSPRRPCRDHVGIDADTRRSPISASPDSFSRTRLIARALRRASDASAPAFGRSRVPAEPASPCRRRQTTSFELRQPLRRRSRRAFFSMPSPSAKRTKPASSTGARRPWPPRRPPSTTWSCRRSRTPARAARLPRRTCASALDHLLDDLAGLPLWPRLLGSALARSRSTPPGRARRRSAPAGWPRRRAWRAACRAPRAWPCRRSTSSATSTPILPSRAPRRCARRRRPRPRTTDRCAGAAQRHVLADGGDHVGQLLCDRLRLPGYGACSAFEVAAGRRAPPWRSSPTKLLELLVPGDEVGLGVDLDEGAARAVRRDADQALGRGAAGLLGGLGEALGAQPVDRGFHVAAGLAQRLLAVHHARRRCSRAVP